MDSRVCVHRSLVLGVLVLYIYVVNNLHLINGNLHVNVVNIITVLFREKHNGLTDSEIYYILRI